MANISFILNEFPGGGAERVTMNLVRPLTELGHKVFIFVHLLNIDKLPDKDLPVEYIKLPYPAGRSKNYATVIETIRRNNIEVFFAPHSFPRYMPKLHALGICKIVHVLHSRPFYELITKHELLIRPPQRTLKYLCRSYLLDWPRYMLGYFHWKFRRRYKTIYRHSDAYGVLFDSYGREIAKELGIEYEGSKFVTLPNPIVANNDGHDNTASREKVVGYVGRLTYYDKRVDRLLAVWHKVYKQFPDWKLWIIGEGGEEQTLKQYVAENNIARVEFLGYTPHVEQLYPKMDIVCLTSNYEGCPMVLLEAQDYGCATIAFDCCSGIGEILAPNWENGVYVPNGDIDAYAEALARLMSDEETRKTIQRNGMENVKRFSVANSVAQYDALIRRLCAK